MRETKFKVWDKANKRMSKPFTFSDVRAYDGEHRTIWFETGDDWTVEIGNDLGYAEKNYSEEMCAEYIFLQYTGLHSKSGVEIYEGDIIQYQDRTFEVLWCNGGFKIMEMKPGYEGAVDGWIHEIIEGCHCGDTIDSLEIIGNIY